MAYGVFGLVAPQVNAPPSWIRHSSPHPPQGNVIGPLSQNGQSSPPSKNAPPDRNRHSWPGAINMGGGGASPGSASTMQGKFSFFGSLGHDQRCTLEASWVHCYVVV